MTNEQMKKVRDALDISFPISPEFVQRQEEALRILDAALAAPAPQPVAWMGYSGVGEKIVSPKAIYSWMTTPLYTAPVAAQREWVALPDKEIAALHKKHLSGDPYYGIFPFMREVDAALKEKNHG